MQKRPTKAIPSTSVNRALLVLSDLISGKEYDRRSVSEKWATSVTTADRDLKALAKVPGVIAERRGTRTVYRFQKNEFPAPTHSLLVALCFGLSHAKVFKNSKYLREIRIGLKSIMNRAVSGNELRDIERKILVLRRGGEAPLPAQPQGIDELLEAVLQSCWVTIDYERFDGRKEKVRIAPLSLAIYDHQLYVIGRSETHPWAPYRVSRIANVAKEIDTFKYPPISAYDPVHAFDDRFGIFLSEDYSLEDVKIRLSGHWRVFARTHQWHQSQQTIEHGDHTLISLRVRGCPELEAWILSFGEHAEVLAPPFLRNRIMERVKQMVKIHSLAGDAAADTT